MSAAALLQRIDQSPGLARARAAAHRWGARVAFLVDSACVAFMSVVFVTLSLAGFDLVKAARLWGDFWTHYADAPSAARTPVTLFLGCAWAVLTLITALVRAPKKTARKAAPETAQ